jgi:hypothetical protein
VGRRGRRRTEPHADRLEDRYPADPDTLSSHSAWDRAMKGPQGWQFVALAFVGFGIAGLALLWWVS